MVGSVSVVYVSARETRRVVECVKRDRSSAAAHPAVSVCIRVIRSRAVGIARDESQSTANR
jgi:hypothetical protein